MAAVGLQPQKALLPTIYKLVCSGQFSASFASLAKESTSSRSNTGTIWQVKRSERTEVVGWTRRQNDEASWRAGSVAAWGMSLGAFGEGARGGVLTSLHPYILVVAMKL